jgi:hypothetical protein
LIARYRWATTPLPSLVSGTWAQDLSRTRVLPYSQRRRGPRRRAPREQR